MGEVPFYSCIRHALGGSFLEIKPHILPLLRENADLNLDIIVKIKREKKLFSRELIFALRPFQVFFAGTDFRA